MLITVPEEGFGGVLIGRLDREVDKTLRKSAAEGSPRIMSKSNESEISGSDLSLISASVDSRTSWTGGCSANLTYLVC